MRKLKLLSVKECVLLGYGSNEGEVEERERFWNDLERVVHILGNR